MAARLAFSAQEVTGPGGDPIQVDVLVNVLLTPANMERLSDVEIEVTVPLDNVPSRVLDIVGVVIRCQHFAG